MATKQQIAKLWQEVFHDSDQFVDLFFNNVYKSENVLCIEQGTEVVSALQMVPYEMKIDHQIVPMAYVCGVCTHPSEQGKGHMNMLMKQAMEVMKQRGYALSTLIPAEPWLFDFYQKFGYTHVINIATETVSLDELGIADSHYRIIPCKNRDGLEYFDQKQRERKCTVLHNASDLETIQQDCVFEGGNGWLALENNRPVGFAFEAPQSDNSILIKDLLYDNLSVNNTLIKFILEFHHAQTARMRVPAEKGQNAQAYGAACIFNNAITDLSNAYLSLMLD